VGRKDRGIVTRGHARGREGRREGTWEGRREGGKEGGREGRKEGGPDIPTASPANPISVMGVSITRLSPYF
jgi:predicted transposase YdaD